MHIPGQVNDMQLCANKRSIFGRILAIFFLIFSQIIQIKLPQEATFLIFGAEKVPMVGGTRLIASTSSQQTDLNFLYKATSFYDDETCKTFPKKFLKKTDIAT